MFWLQRTGFVMNSQFKEVLAVFTSIFGEQCSPLYTLQKEKGNSFHMDVDTCKHPQSLNLVGVSCKSQRTGIWSQNKTVQVLVHAAPEVLLVALQAASCLVFYFHTRGSLHEPVQHFILELVNVSEVSFWSVCTTGLLSSRDTSTNGQDAC